MKQFTSTDSKSSRALLLPLCKTDPSSCQQLLHQSPILFQPANNSQVHRPTSQDQGNNQAVQRRRRARKRGETNNGKDFMRLCDLPPSRVLACLTVHAPNSTPNTHHRKHLRKPHHLLYRPADESSIFYLVKVPYLAATGPLRS